MLYNYILRPILFRFDPERVHEFAMARLEAHAGLIGLLRPAFVYEHPSLVQDVFGCTFKNPTGLAAGFDKYARGLAVWPRLGFGHVEIGTITGQAQSGNDRPRLFRLPADGALINRFGFNNDGAQRTAATLSRGWKTRGRPTIPVGINIGKSKVVELDRAAEDYAASFVALWPFADYFTVNVSSPNTPGLRQLQDRQFLKDLLLRLMDLGRRRAKDEGRAEKAILVKIAPDLSWPQIDDVVRVAEETGISGLIATNTTLSREHLRSSVRLTSEAGGLSGEPIRARSTEILRYIRRASAGRLVLIGAGGVKTGDDAYEKITAGASLVQVYTGFVYQGPSLCRQINRRLVHLLRADGFNSIADAVGCRAQINKE